MSPFLFIEYYNSPKVGTNVEIIFAQITNEPRQIDASHKL